MARKPENPKIATWWSQKREYQMYKNSSKQTLACVSTFEHELANLAQRLGTDVYKTGWPDFLFVRDGEGTFIEVKSERDILRCEQIRMLKALESIGLKVRIALAESKEMVTIDEFLQARLSEKL